MHFHLPISASCLLLTAYPDAVTKQVFLAAFILSMSAEGPWIYQAKLENTDSDRGNVDRVTSHALSCPLPPHSTQSPAKHRWRIYLYDFHSALRCLFFFPLLDKPRDGMRWMRRNKHISTPQQSSVTM